MTDTPFGPVRQYLLGLQDRIVQALQQLDGKTFTTDAWVRPAGERLQGDGRTQLVEEGGLPSGRAANMRTFMCTVGTMGLRG